VTQLPKAMSAPAFPVTLGVPAAMGGQATMMMTSSHHHHHDVAEEGATICCGIFCLFLGKRIGGCIKVVYLKPSHQRIFQLILNIC